MATIKEKREYRSYRAEVLFGIFLSLALTVFGFVLSAAPFTEFSAGDNYIIAIVLGIVDIIMITMAFMNKRLGLRLDAIVSTLRRFGVAPCSNKVARDLLEKKANEIKHMNEQLNEYGRYTLDRTKTYRELTELTNVMDDRHGDEMVAISSINIEDWESAHAQVYLEATREAVTRRVPVRRLFILEKEELQGVERRRYLEVVNKNHEALKPPADADPRLKQSGIRWLYKRDVSEEHRTIDIAIFANKALMIQLTGQEYQFIISPDEVIRNLVIFQSLWNREDAKSIDDLKRIILGRNKHRKS